MNSFCAIADVRGSELEFDRLRNMGRALCPGGELYTEACIDRGIGILCVGSSAERGAVRQPYATLTENGELYTAISCAPSRADAAMALAETYKAQKYEAPRELGGHFALAVLDRRRRELLLATDPLGAMPIFLHRDGEKIVISSRLAPLLRYAPDAAEIDRRALLELIRAPEGEVSVGELFKNISELKASSFMIFSGLGAQTFEYHAKSEPPPAPPTPLFAQKLMPKRDADLQKCAEEMTLALGYPSFELSTPEYIAAIRAAALKKSDMLIETKRHRLSCVHAYRSLYALGARFGTDVYLAGSDTEINFKRSFLSEREKRLSDIAFSILSNERSHIRRTFGRNLETIVSEESDASAKIGILGKIIGLERWLESYPIIPI